MSLQLYLAFVAACIALALLPGPVVTLVIANGLRHGTRAAGRARLFFSAQRTRLLSRISGGVMIGGGVWLALTRAR